MPARAASTARCALLPYELSAPASSASVMVTPLNPSRPRSSRWITTGDNPMPTLESLTTPRVVVWPESPMNFSYADDEEFRAFVGEFAREQRAAVLFNSLEPAPNPDALAGPVHGQRKNDQEPGIRARRLRFDLPFGWPHRRPLRFRSAGFRSS